MVDTNVIISALIRPHGISANVLDVLTGVPTYLPEEILDELKKHLLLIAKKRGEDPDLIHAEISFILGEFETVPMKNYLYLREDAEKLVTDRGDAPFVALALYLLRRYPRVVLLSYNKRHFRVKELAKRNVLVFTPVEFINWLRENVQ